MGKDKKQKNKNSKPGRIIKLEKLYKDRDWHKFKGKPVIPLGAETATHNLVGSLTSRFNLIIAGKPGSGKSTFFHSAVINLLKNTKPKDLKFIFIDTKKKDLVEYQYLPNLLFPVITNALDAKRAINWCSYEFERRLNLIRADKKITLDEYNKGRKEKLPRILVAISECSDLMRNEFSFYRKVLSLMTSSSLLTNINIILGTSRISKRVYPEKLINSFIYRMALATRSSAQSKALIKEKGAERLRGKGDLLLLRTEPGYDIFGRKQKVNSAEKILNHLQGFYVNKNEIAKVVSTIKG